MDNNWYSMYKIGNQLVDERLRIASEERRYYAKRTFQPELRLPRILQLRAVFVSIMPIFGHRRER